MCVYHLKLHKQIGVYSQLHVLIAIIVSFQNFLL